MDKNLINLIVIVALALIGLLAVITLIYWPELMAAHRWSQVRKAHRMPKENLNSGKSASISTPIKPQNDDYSQNFKKW